MGPLTETKIVAQSEGANSRAHLQPLDLETDATILAKQGSAKRHWLGLSIHGSFERNQNTGPE